MNRADGDALQIEDVVAQKLCCAADLTVFPFAHDQLQQGPALFTAEASDLHRLGGQAVEADAAGPLIQHPLAWLSLHPDR